MELLLLVLVQAAVVAGINILLIYIKLKKTSYKEVSGNNLWKIIFDKGIYGEFLTYAILEKKGKQRILTNVYLKKS